MTKCLRMIWLNIDYYQRWINNEYQYWIWIHFNLLSYAKWYDKDNIIIFNVLIRLFRNLFRTFDFFIKFIHFMNHKNFHGQMAKLLSVHYVRIFQIFFVVIIFILMTLQKSTTDNYGRKIHYHLSLIQKKTMINKVNKLQMSD